MPDPLILTLAMTGAGFDRLQRWRAAHFPDRGYTLPAHLTLFHHLPGRKIDLIDAALQGIVSRRPPFTLHAHRIVPFSQGFAIGTHSPALKPLRRNLAATFRADLTRQDQRDLRPHVTIQNKVESDRAKTDRHAFARAFAPFPITATGLDLWHYRGGPWEHATYYPFGGIA